MDFATLLSQELLKSKASGTTKSYVRRSELEAQRLAAYEAEQKALDEKRKTKIAVKRKLEAEQAEEDREREERRQRLAEETRSRREEREAAEERDRRRRLGLCETPPTETPANQDVAEADADLDADADVAEEELLRSLRALGEPVVLFGESHTGRLRRLRRRTALVATGPIPTTLQLVTEKDMKVDGSVPPPAGEPRRWLFRQLASYFSMVMAEYEKAMEAERRDTMASKTAYKAMVQCKENMKPLFRKFEKNDLDDSILTAVVEIVQAAQERRYVDAIDVYLRLSIGKAAWPIGVTMVGIHERSAREKLHGGERGHVMGDEVTRKFLQSIKRCLTFAQIRWPPESARQMMG